MEPKQPGSGMGYEQPRVKLEEGYQYSNDPNRQADGAAERIGERSVEAQSAAQVEVVNSQLVLPSLPVPVLTTLADDDSQSVSATSDDNPLVAGDDELIEKEWIDKAKKVISETKDDPYRREREISKLQIDYISKRYGRKVGDAGD